MQSLAVVARAVDNEYVARRVLQMRSGIERGETLTRTAVASDLFTPIILQMLEVGEQTGAVDDLLEEVADFYDREIEQDIKAFASSIEPVLTVIVSVLVLIVALAVFLPLWDLSTTLRKG